MHSEILKVEKVAKAVNGRVYRHYSGRGMFGRCCIGINCDDMTACIEEAASEGLRNAKIDQLGKGYIVYWPNITDELP